MYKLAVDDTVFTWADIVNIYEENYNAFDLVYFPR